MPAIFDGYGVGHLRFQVPYPLPFDSADYVTAAANTACIRTLAADADRPNVIGQISWSYSAAPTGGTIEIKDGTTVVFSQDVTSAGLGSIIFNPPRLGTRNATMTITLAAGGAAVVGKLWANAWLLK